MYRTEDPALKETLLSLREVLRRLDRSERSTALLSLLLSQGFQEKVGKAEAAFDFWATRKALGIAPDEENEAIVAEGMAAMVNILEGISQSEPDANQLTMFPPPILLIQGTEDCFVPTHQPQLLRQLLGGNVRTVLRPNGLVVPEPDNFQNEDDITMPPGEATGPAKLLHIAWLKAGHEILEERGAYVLAILSSLINACHGLNLNTTLQEGEEPEEEEPDDPTWREEETVSSLGVDTDSLTENSPLPEAFQVTARSRSLSLSTVIRKRLEKKKTVSAQKCK